ncbi:hypothetical protein FACS1894192_01400 [Bacilli bacterium]|nr:hypothetical protein FACS1894192_01400 [Bacilli bacterium]
MLSKITNYLKELNIIIKYRQIEGNGSFNVVKNKPILVINESLNEIDTALTLLHETAHFLNKDGGQYIPNHFVNDDIEFEANRYMIYEVMKFLDQKYDFQPDTNYQIIIDNLDLPYHLDGVILDAFISLIQDKFEIKEETTQEEYWWYY